MTIPVTVSVAALIPTCRHLLHLRDEAVPASGNGYHIAVFPAIVAERLSDSGDVLCKVVLLDRRIRPHGFDELVFLDDPSVISNECEESVKDLGRHRHKL